MTAETNQAEFAAKFPEGRWARALSFMSALTRSIMACFRWVLSAATVFNVSAVAVVKNAWKRCVSNNVGWPSAAFGFSSGIRRTTRRPVIRSAFLRELNAVNPVSATSAADTQVSASSS